MQYKKLLAIVLGALSALACIIIIVLAVLYFGLKNQESANLEELNTLYNKQQELQNANIELTTKLQELTIAYNTGNNGNQVIPTPTPTPNITTPSITPTPIVTPTPQLTRKIRLYVFNKTLDPNVENCVANDYVFRIIPGSMTPLTDTVKTLFSTPVSQDESNAGYQNFFNDPNDANFKYYGPVSLTSASIDSNGVATLTLDHGGLTSGGSCRAGIMKSQLEMTAMQFDTVKSVKILPELLFQP